MATVTADQARPGMVLVSDVKDPKGRLLIPAGNELSERHVQALKMWGVSSLDVEGDEPADEPMVDVSPEMMAAAEAGADEILSANDPAHPFVQVFRGAVIKAQIEKLAAEAAA